MFVSISEEHAAFIFRVVEAGCSFEMSVNIYQTTQHHTIEGNNLYSHHYVNLKSLVDVYV